MVAVPWPSRTTLESSGPIKTVSLQTPLTNKVSPGLSFPMAELRVPLELQFTLFVAASTIETIKNMAATVAREFKDVLNAVMRRPPRLSILFV
jgi:hypothetical protein